MRRALPTLATLLFFSADAAADPLVDLVDRGASRVTLDGVLREWTTTLSAVDDRSQVQSGGAAWTGPDDASFAFVVGRDDAALYLAAEVRDDRVVRSRQHRPADDALLVSIAFPNGRLWTAWEIALQPGEPGAYTGAVRYRVPRVRPVPGAEIVEAPLRAGSGFTVEARIPWAAMPGLRENLNVARVRIAYADADQEAHPAVETVLANGSGDARHPQELPPTTASAPAVAAAAADLLARFRREHMVAESVRAILDRRADLTGTSEPERVVVLPRHLVAYGPGIEGGASYTFLEFPQGEVVSAQALDLTGDRKTDVALTVRVDAGPFERTLLHVYAMDGAGVFQRVFAREIGRRQGAQRVLDTMRFQGTRVTFTAGAAEGFTAATWPSAVEPGVEPPLTPWSPHRAETWAWNPSSRSFALERSEANAGATEAPGGAQGEVEAPRESAEPTADVAGVLRLFRQREHVDEGARPSLRATGDAAEDATPEQFYIYGRTLVVVGPRFMNGRSYASISLAANEGDEVIGLRTADLTDDGHVEAVVTVRRNVTVTVQGAPIASQRDMVFAYSFDAAHRGRIFAAEVGRRVGDASISNNVVLPSGARGSQITVEARPPRGWTQATYPFHDAAPQGYEALLLPWQEPHRVAWRWSGTAMVREP